MRMIRNGHYCIYHGKEYNITHDMQDNTKIYTRNKDIVDKTFRIKDVYGTMYEKIIDPEEIQEAYRISTKAIIDGDELSICRAPGGAENMYWVESGSKELKEKYHMKEIDRGIYGTWIEKDKVQVVERRTNVDHLYKKIKNS